MSHILMYICVYMLLYIYLIWVWYHTTPQILTLPPLEGYQRIKVKIKVRIHVYVKGWVEKLRFLFLLCCARFCWKSCKFIFSLTWHQDREIASVNVQLNVWNLHEIRVFMKMSTFMRIVCCCAGFSFSCRNLDFSSNV